MLTPLAIVFLAVLAISGWQAWDANRKLRKRIRAGWGRPRAAHPDMDPIADFFRASEAAETLDDRTWNDLLLDDVFAALDRTESSIGQQMLYRRLRSAPAPRSLDAFEALINRVSRDSRLRERAQIALARLRHPSAYYLHRLTQPETLIRKPWHALFPVWAAIVATTLALGFIWHILFLIAFLGVAVNFVVRIASGRRISGEIVWFRQVGPLLSLARSLTIFHDASTAPVTGSLREDLSALRRLRAVARWVSRDIGTADPIIPTILEYLNLLFLMDANALYFAGAELKRRAPQLLRVIETVGEIDCAIAVASFRTSAEDWIRPRFATPDAPASFADIRHPLVDNPVPNSIQVAPPHGVLITGSNMSGKSTFLRTVGVNVVLAQTIHTCLARDYFAPIYKALSCIGRADDLIAGKSYYLVEVESVLSLVAASEESAPHLFIFDELFRGTNAVERIAAGEAVLNSLVANGKPHVVLAATHDGELVDLLRDRYAIYHLSDSIGPEGLSFDYHLIPGPATSRNAIALLKHSGAPDSLVSRALESAARIDKQRRAEQLD